MGLDGGTIISRSDVVRGSSWRVASADGSCRSTRGGQIGASFVASKEGVPATENAHARWATCALTGEVLQEPVVCCRLGKLYTRENVLAFLLAKKGKVFLDEAAKWRFQNQSQFSKDFAHLRTTKDVFVLRTESSSSQPPAAASAIADRTHAEVRTREKDTDDNKKQRRKDDCHNSTCSSTADGSADYCSAERGRDCGNAASSSEQHRNRIEWVCPLTGAIAGSRQQAFSAIQVCGHLFSAKALREVGNGRCPTCDAAYDSDQVILINGSSEHMESLQKRLREEEKARRAVKRSKTEVVGHTLA
ncbi:hypothetical protein CBR_g37538 [Chara braunii]|uniref:Uncharacterized protein n=1 Tax=Chara braunii TaxID=69332 RepID=A0A388LN33_CHABU|nr:hypothetical protein CBR_g37538 [Chara braunii]|eukprot:GBG83737.1 hypothetical protein CBR_g37538 [Chara braunii]